VVTFGALVVLRLVAEPSSWAGLALAAMCLGGVYIVALATFSLRAEDRADLSQAIDRLRSSSVRE
jgi:hypothetical protein